jgi:hypothetical protein
MDGAGQRRGRRAGRRRVPGAHQRYPERTRGSPTADGKTIVCGAWGVFRPGNLPGGTCPTAPPWNDQGFLEYSTATGKLTRTLYRYDTSCIPHLGQAQVLWATPSGDTVIGYFDFQAMFPASSKPVMRFGIYRENKFTPLPAPPSTDPGTIAW